MSCWMCTRRAASLSVHATQSSTPHKHTQPYSYRLLGSHTRLRRLQPARRRIGRAQDKDDDLVRVSEEVELTEEEQEPDYSSAAFEPSASSDEPSAPEAQQQYEARYALNVLWLDKSIGLAVDQVFRQNQKSPITEFFFWPKADAWEQLNVSIEGKDWISERNRVLLLNMTTDIINFWQDEETKHTIEEAREKFPDVVFQGA